MSKRENISIHALREEGDLPVSTICTASCKFLSTPSARRATHFCFRGPHCVVISIHALREEGDIQDRPETPKGGISIHALREEGDPVRLPWWCQSSYFYPRPPRGGRHQRSGEPGCGGRISIHALREEGDASSESAASTKRQFLSTPSARRATLPRLPEKPYMEISIHALREEGDTATTSPHGSQSYFYPRPPRGGRPGMPRPLRTVCGISIHALREEGDSRHAVPSLALGISIHALREEGDDCNAWSHGVAIGISIHALREEGDQCSQSNRLGTKKFLSTPSARRATPTGWYDWQNSTNFYPRPPRGGRQLRFVVHCQGSLFLSTPSARRATHPCRGAIPAGSISIHALREEGDRATARRYPFSGDFYPRPPRGGRRSRWRRSWWHQQFLSTPSARRATERPCASSRSCHISIHALREEGDTECICRIHQMHQYFYPRPPRGGRRGRCRFRAMPYPYFYPRPPRGGRPGRCKHSERSTGFLSTPSARRATRCGFPPVTYRAFLSTPSARRATCGCC